MIWWPRLPWLRLALFAPALLLAACAAPPPRIVQVPVQVPVVTMESGDVAARQFFAYSERLAHMDGAARQQEQNRLQAAPRTPANLMYLALIMGQSDNNADLAHALALLDTLNQSRDPEAQAWLPLSHLLSTLYTAAAGKRQKLHDQIDHQAQQLRDAQGKYDQLNDRYSQLSQKLDALKAIELSLPNRPAVASEPAAGSAPGQTP